MSLPLRFVLPILLGAGLCTAQDPRDLDPNSNLALNRAVTFLPAPNYSSTTKGDATDLTDGITTSRADQRIWFEPSSVCWTYPGRVNFAVDLGSVQPIEEIAVRWLGGGATSGATIPVWVEALVSDGDGQPFYRVADYSRWNPGDNAKYGVPRSQGRGWVHRLRFAGLKTRGRVVGIRFYGTAFTCSDEIYVFRGTHDASAVTRDPSTLDDFTVTQAEMYFHKPAAHVATNVVAPLAVGMNSVASTDAKPMTVALTLPPGVRLAGGGFGGTPDVVETADGAAYTWNFSSRGVNNKVFGRLYLTGSPRPGAKPEMQYQLRWGDFASPRMRVPVQFVEVPRADPRPLRLLTSLSGGGQIEITRAWPEWRQAYDTAGLNAVPIYLDGATDAAMAGFAADARAYGYKIDGIDSTFFRMVSRRSSQGEIYCQFADGTRGSRMCPSYRGQYYAEELRRVADAAIQFQPSYLHCDVEVWNASGPTDSTRCTRCLADKAASGVEAWSDWRLAKGEQMWRDLWASLQDAVKRSGGPPLDIGMYDARPGESYQTAWPFDRLYPNAMQHSEVSTYTALEPFDIETVGNEVRLDRSRLPRSDVMPYISPGDAGTFPADDFYHVLLECFFNGARGINFWSSRVWDADFLAAYAKAIGVVAPVEDIILDGELFVPLLEGEGQIGAGRVAGIRRGGEAILLVSDYWGDTPGLVKVKLDSSSVLRVVDLETRSEIGTAAAGASVLFVSVPKGGVRALHLCPADAKGGIRAQRYQMRKAAR